MRKPSPLEPIRRGKADPTLAYKQKLSITSADPKAVSGVLKEELRQFSEDVKNLLDCFRQFPEFVDELPDPAIAHRLEVCTHTTMCPLMSLRNRLIMNPGFCDTVRGL